MSRGLRPFRSRIARLLASALVALSLLVNGLAITQASMTRHACCDQMGMTAAQGDRGDHAKTPCPDQGDCDDQCQMRCQAGNALPSFALAIAAIALPRPTLPTLTAGPFVSTDPVPGLRPPISA